MGKCILTVDDSKTMREMVNTTLKEAGFEVIEAEDGQNALEVLQKNSKVDLIITDIYMPKMDGIEFIKALRANPDYKFVPVIVLTTEAGSATKERGKEAGATGWVVKPFNPEKMLQIVNKLCG